MISVQLQGGLGNQMFQVATAFNLAKKNSTSAYFNFDSSHTLNQGRQSINYKDNIFRFFDHRESLQHAHYYKQDNFEYHELPREDNILLNGYFQSEKFFYESKDEIRERFTNGLFYNPNADIEIFLHDIRKVAKNKPIVSLHVRRGDYLRFPSVHPCCDVDYYKRAIAKLLNEIDEFVPLIVSDDKHWCLQNIPGIISPFGDELSELALMALADHNIIANSSFSWWGAYLNKNPGKIVIGPKRWFGEAGPKIQDDIIPASWRKI